MLKKLSKFFYKNYFDTEFSLEYRLYMIFFMESYLISILSATTNTLLGKGIWGIVLQWSYILFCTIVLFISKDRRQQMSKPIMIFISFFYIPFLFFTTAGYYGTALMFSLLGIFIIAVLFKGKRRIVILTLNIVLYVVCCFLQYRFPEWVTPHDGEQAKFIDFVVALVLSTAGLGIMTIYIINAFNTDRLHIQRLLMNLEESNETLAELSIRDALTGLYNRRYFEQYLENEIDRSNGQNKTFYLMMLDLDKFKVLNDHYGHSFGDEVLVMFSKTVQHVLRKKGVFARIGGEEFMIVLNSMTFDDAKRIAEKIREVIAHMTLGNSERITVSIGLVKSKPNDTPEKIILRVDSLLYQAKNRGRNLVIYDSE